jgi:Flp pilus assembly protein TadG
MAEFALILPIALLILFGIIQFGFLFSSQIGLVNALRETARFASTSQVNNSTVATTIGSNVCDYLLNEGSYVGSGAMVRMAGYESGAVVRGGSTFVRYDSYTDPHQAPATYSVRVTIHTEYKHLLLVPLVNVILDGLDGTSDGRFQLGATEAMRVENPLLMTAPTGFPVTENC